MQRRLSWTLAASLLLLGLLAVALSSDRGLAAAQSAVVSPDGAIVTSEPQPKDPAPAAAAAEQAPPNPDDELKPLQRPKAATPRRRATKVSEADKAAAIRAWARGNTAMESNDSLAAVSEYKECVGLYPQFPPCHLNLGLAYRAAGNFPRALTSLKAALKMMNESDVGLRSRAYNYIGVTLKAQGKVAEAIDAYQTALALNSTNPAVRYNLGLLYITQGRAEEGLSELQQSFEQEPDNADTAWALASALQGAGEHAESMKMWQHAVSLRPDDLKLTGAMTRFVEQHPHYFKQLLGQGMVLPEVESGKAKGLVLSYWIDPTGALGSFGQCRMLKSAAHNRLTVEMLGYGKDKKGPGQQLISLQRRLEHVEDDVVVFFAHAANTVFLDTLPVMIDKFVNMKTTDGQPVEWLFAGSCACVPFALYANATCDTMPIGRYRFIQPELFAARAGMMKAIIGDIRKNARLWSNSTSASLADVFGLERVFTDYMASGVGRGMMVDTNGALLHSFSTPMYPSSASTLAIQTDPAVLSRCNPLGDIDLSHLLVWNEATGSTPSILNFPEPNGNEAYNVLAKHFWFNQVADSESHPLPKLETHEWRRATFVRGGKEVRLSELCEE